MIFMSSAAHLPLSILKEKKSSNTAKHYEKMKKNLSIIPLPKWPPLHTAALWAPFWNKRHIFMISIHKNLNISL